MSNHRMTFVCIGLALSFTFLSSAHCDETAAQSLYAALPGAKNYASISVLDVTESPREKGRLRYDLLARAASDEDVSRYMRHLSQIDPAVKVELNFAKIVLVPKQGMNNGVIESKNTRAVEFKIIIVKKAPPVPPPWEKQAPNSRPETGVRFRE